MLCCLLEISYPILNLKVLRPSDFALVKHFNTLQLVKDFSQNDCEAKEKWYKRSRIRMNSNNWVCYHVLTIGAKVQCLPQAILASSKSFQSCAHTIRGTLERYGRRSGISTVAGNQRQKGTHSKGNQRQHFSHLLVSLCPLNEGQCRNRSILKMS